MWLGSRRAGQGWLVFVAASGLVLATLLPAVPAAAQSHPGLGQPGQEPVEVVKGEILVKFKPGTSGQAIAETHRQNNGQEMRQIAQVGARVVAVPPGQERSRAAGYRANPNVAYAEVNGLYYALGFTPNDPRYPSQWQYESAGGGGGQRDADIDASGAWQTTQGTSSVAIAILDTGIDRSHEDLTRGAKVVKTQNFTDPVADSEAADDYYGHGTHVAGSAAASTNNGIGVAGTCPACSLYNVKVLGNDGSGAWSGIADGIVWAADNGAKVINMSLGSYSPSDTVRDAVDYAWGKGVVLVGAAGNDGKNWGLYPAAYPNVIAVAATDKRDARASFSNYGSNWVSLAAPGANILSTATDHPSTLFGTGPTYGTLSGTSMATPHVAGVTGLVWSTGLCGAADGACVRGRLQSTADKISGTGRFWIYGRLNACRAVGGSGC
jgi:thermitase